MFKRINFENFGSFKSFTWQSPQLGLTNKEDNEFKKLNIIYGRNYAGKTTLSRLFRYLETNQIPADYEDFTFSLIDENDIEITQDNISELSANYNVKVYNHDFVKSNLSWLFHKEGTIEPIAILGEENIEIKDRISEIKSKLHNDNINNMGLVNIFDEKNNILLTKLEEYEAKEKELIKVLREKARSIKNNTIHYNKVNYNIQNLRDDIKLINSDKDILTNLEVKKFEDQLKEVHRDEISFIEPIRIDYSQVINDTNELLTKEVNSSVPIKELLDENDLQEWVRNGLILHKEKNNTTCAFCESMISDERWLELEEHFNPESEDLRKQIKKQSSLITNIEENFKNIKFNNENEFYSHVRTDIKTIETELQNSIQNNLHIFDNMKDALANRLKDILSACNYMEFENFYDDYLSLTEKYNEIVLINNNWSHEIESKQNKASEKLRKNEVANFVASISYHDKKDNIVRLDLEVNQLRSELKEHKIEIDSLEHQIVQLETSLEDEGKGAELVNKFLNSCFGHQELFLNPIEVDRSITFEILRKDKLATNLSEGEMSLISFCYFIAKVHDEINNKNQKPIIFIDDPISSLDNNHIYFIFSLIEKEIAKNCDYNQLFISTHNLDFLKYLKRLTVPKVEDKSSINHFLIEKMRKKNLASSFILTMPQHMKNYTTEFHYLFSEIYKVYCDISINEHKLQNTYNTFYNLPNNIRKFLEAYLFYKYPNNDKPLKNLEKLFDGNIPLVLNRVINEYSHLVFIERGWKPVDVPEMEICVEIIIDKLKEVDPEQFEALKESVQKNK